MNAAHVFLLCILGATLLSTVLCTSGNSPNECCFKFYPRRVKKEVIGKYYATDYRCPKAGVIFVTAEKGHNICVDPSLTWVQNIMKKLDEDDLK